MRSFSIIALVLLLAVAAGCARPKPGLLEFPDEPELHQACVKFYDYIRHKELDLFMDQQGLTEFFPDRKSYYDFLDTAVPPMRERRFERNRIIDYTIRSINMDPLEDRAYVRVTFYSDDTLPFGKVLQAMHEWIKGPGGWYPGKVVAPKASYWDKLR